MCVYVSTRVQLQYQDLRQGAYICDCVFRLPPSGSCIHLAKTRGGCGIFAHLLPKLVLHNPENETVRALNTSHPVQQAESPADLNDHVCNFILLLTDLHLHYLVPCPCPWPLVVPGLLLALSPKVTQHRKILHPQGWSPHPKLPALFFFPFPNNFSRHFREHLRLFTGT